MYSYFSIQIAYRALIWQKEASGKSEICCTSLEQNVSVIPTDINNDV